MQLRVTMLFNIGGRAIAMLIGIIVVPIYLHLLGLAGIGLIAFYTAVYGVAAVVDQALSTTLIRETSRYRNLEHEAQAVVDTLRTLEGITLLIGVSIFAISSIFHAQIANAFLTTSPLAPNVLRLCIIMMGAAIAIQLMLSLQANMASALDRADLSNALTLLASLLRAIFSVSGLLVVENTPIVYFAGQLVALVLTLAVSTWLIWRAVPTAAPAKMRLILISDAMRYLPALVGSASLFVAITQIDKLVVAKMLTVADLGRYYLASTVAGMIWAPLAPVHLTLMPRFSALLARHDLTAVKRLSHVASQFLTFAIVPTTVLALIFPQQIIFLWTGQNDVAIEAAPLLSVLALGSGLWALAGVPNTLQFAAGTAKYSFLAGFIGLILIPAGAIASLHIGAIGPALVLTGAATFQLFVLPLGIFRRLRLETSRAWYVSDVGAQCLAAGLVGSAFVFFSIETTGRLIVAIKLLGHFVVLSMAVLVVSSELRNVLSTYFKSVLIRRTAT